MMIRTQTLYNIGLAILLQWSFIYWLPFFNLSDSQWLMIRTIFLAAGLALILLVFAIQTTKVGFIRNSIRLSFLAFLVMFFIVAISISSAAHKYFSQDYGNKLLSGIVILLLLSTYRMAWNFINSRVASFLLFTTSILVSLVTLQGFLPIFNVANPFNNYALEVTGLTTGRTSYSGSLSLLFGLSLYKARLHNIKSLYLAAILILSSQITVAGRGGLLVSLMLLVFIFFSWKKVQVLATVSLLSSVVYWISISGSLDLEKELRLDGEDISSGRLSMYEVFPNLFNNAILTGSGSERLGTFFKDYFGEDFEFHNVVLLATLEYGLFAGLALLLFFISSVVFAVRLFGIGYYELSGILIGGFILSLLEPAVVFGNFSVWILWSIVLTGSEGAFEFAHEEVDIRS